MDDTERRTGLAIYRADLNLDMLTLESTSVCNLRCVMCPHAIGEVKRPKHFPVELLDRLWPVVESANSLQLHGIGEPLHSPAFWRLLRRLGPDAKPHSISTNTNLTVLSDEQIEDLLDSSISEVMISLDAATPETYRDIRGFDLEQVLDNIRRLVARRLERRQERPALVINMTVMEHNIRELPDFVRLAKKLRVDAVSFWHLNHFPNYQLESRTGWSFDYHQQMLVNHKRLANECISEAYRVAESLAVLIRAPKTKTILFDLEADD